MRAAAVTGWTLSLGTEMRNLNINLDDLTQAALKRLVHQLLAAPDGEEKEILDQLTKRQKRAADESNDLADLNEEMRGAPSKIAVEEDEEDEDEDTEPKKKRR